MNAKIALGLFSCVCLAACGGNQPAPQAQPPATQAPAATAPAAAAPAGETAAAPAAAPVAEFGVPECDSYIARYTACIDSKIPEAGRAAVRQGLEQAKAAWKQAASTPEGKKGLAMACTQATEAAKTGMQAYGCTW